MSVKRKFPYSSSVFRDKKKMLGLGCSHCYYRRSWRREYVRKSIVTANSFVNDDRRALLDIRFGILYESQISKTMGNRI